MLLFGLVPIQCQSTFGRTILDPLMSSRVLTSVGWIELKMLESFSCLNLHGGSGIDQPPILSRPDLAKERSLSRLIFICLNHKVGWIDRSTSELLALRISSSVKPSTSFNTTIQWAATVIPLSQLWGLPPRSKRTSCVIQNLPSPH